MIYTNPNPNPNPTYRCGNRGCDPSKCEAVRICYKCKEIGHLASMCPKKYNPNKTYI